MPRLNFMFILYYVSDVFIETIKPSLIVRIER